MTKGQTAIRETVAAMTKALMMWPPPDVIDVPMWVFCNPREGAAVSGVITVGPIEVVRAIASSRVDRTKAQKPRFPGRP